MPEVVETVRVVPVRHSWMPWLVRILVGGGLFVFVLGKSIATYGLVRDESWSVGQPMSFIILVYGVAIATPFALLEGYFSRREGRLWLENGLAAAGALVISWFAALPVGLRFGGGRDPVEQRYIEMALSSLLLMGSVYILIVLLCRPLKR